MLYSALAFLVVAVTMLALGLAGIVPGAAGIANIAFLLSLGFLAAKAIMLGTHPHDRHQHLAHR
jgi:uncharacterized membrane protein YtjA (UPF0391 family)